MSWAPMPDVNRGEVWWIDAPEIGRRPGCILTRSGVIPVLSSVLVAPATRTIRGIPTEVFLDRADGMPEDCVLSMDNLTVVPKSMLSERITMLSPPRLEEACTALAVATGCR